MAELNEDLHAQVKAEVEGKEITAAQRSMLFQKYGLQEPHLPVEDLIVNQLWRLKHTKWVTGEKS